ncbi:hypothetical protein NITHO_1890002 [Nitrolancea hollandica Lb]|uniref:Uncharacterized protein n=1 Tax=Nitrolancea hollandica Lb TaxID=1129897 RepID=I4EEL0_9BACT|nr:hypothetical protein NITHO_1890002 [Nitrolancea hollandica Lb]
MRVHQKWTPPVQWLVAANHCLCSVVDVVRQGAGITSSLIICSHALPLRCAPLAFGVASPLISDQLTRDYTMGKYTGCQARE